MKDKVKPIGWGTTILGMKDAWNGIMTIKNSPLRGLPSSWAVALHVERVVHGRQLGERLDERAVRRDVPETGRRRRVPRLPRARAPRHAHIPLRIPQLIPEPPRDDQ